jgi:DtxR family Mn-dependent transcriptional regulator
MLTRKKGEGDRSIQTLAEDLLKAVAHRKWLDMTWHVDELQPGKVETTMSMALAAELLERLGHIERVEGKWRLTEKGRERAVELVRAHRLVETYLARMEGLPTGELHAKADEAEHHLTSEGINELADTLNRPRFDPHGDPIPERARDLHEESQMPLVQAEEGLEAKIVHIEDEPEEDFKKLMELGLALELPLRILKQTGKSTVIELAGEELDLPTQLAALLEVIPLREGETFPQDLHRLALLDFGETGTVEFISPSCMGPERRRLLDFGLVPGSEVRCEFSSPFGSPIAYSVRGSTIGLRRRQARNIFIRRSS